MGVQKLVLNIVLFIEGLFLKGVKQRKKRVLFITTNGSKPSEDMTAIMRELRIRGYNDIVFSGSNFDGSLMDKLRYFFKCLYQYYLMHTAGLLILDYNNFLAGEHKPKRLRVMEIWHASGAIKKFGAQLNDVDYTVGGYDRVICTGDYWRDIYSKGFNIDPQNVIAAGLPRNQDLLSKAERYKDHEHRVLYAPTFRGTRLTGVHNVTFDRESLEESLPKGWRVDCKYHPFTDGVSTTTEDTYTLLAKSDILITDYSSLVFDFSLLDRPTIFYAPDLEEYRKEPGFNIDIERDMMGYVVKTQEELARAVNEVIRTGNNNGFWIHKKYMNFEYRLIEEIVSLLEI